ncbi:MAG: DNA-processing protein DprA [Planctomycetaceae bacterium]
MARARRSPERAYIPPTDVRRTSLAALLEGVRKLPAKKAQLFGADQEEDGQALWYSGDATLVRGRCVAVVGTRKATPSGAARARRLARELAEAGIVVVSGLAEGVDTEALTAALDAGGRVIAVIGTPLDRAYPSENGPLQEAIYREHLLVSQFPVGSPVSKSNFPRRNRLMAALCDGTAIVEAGDTAGTLHQAAECLRLDRWLFIAQSVTVDRTLAWPAKFVGYERTRVFSTTGDILRVLG